MSPGDRFGRWTVVRPSSPAKEYPAAQGHRPRVLTRCVCGHEQVSWCHLLTKSQSTGCSSRRCMARWEAGNELKEKLDAWLADWIKEVRAEPVEPTE